ncbi:hypothetical protein EDB86DRAFT_2918234 [Lactarius hatsudake]|nr:hypothetical protein EDB86DRAFT_2918234 [Lactarius hatsudake]
MALGTISSVIVVAIAFSIMFFKFAIRGSRRHNGPVAFSSYCVCVSAMILPWILLDKLTLPGSKASTPCLRLTGLSACLPQ